MSFSSLKKSSQDFDALREKIKPPQFGGSDDNFYPDVDASGNGYVKVRLLPAKDGISHVVSYSKFNAKNLAGTKTYKSMNRRSIKKEDAFGEFMSALWNQGTEEAKELYKARKMKRVNVCYLQIIEDKITPDNNGKIKKFYMPMSIMKKIEEAIDPDNPFNDPDIKAFNPFDLFGKAGGRDFVIRTKNKDGYRNYEDSGFVDNASPWLEDEAEMEKLWEAEVTDLTELIAEDKFTDYQKQVEMIEEVFGNEPLSGRIIKDLFGSKLNNSAGKSISQTSSEKSEEVKKKEPEAKKSSSENKVDFSDDDFDIDDFD